MERPPKPPLPPPPLPPPPLPLPVVSVAVGVGEVGVGELDGVGVLAFCGCTKIVIVVPLGSTWPAGGFWL